MKILVLEDDPSRTYTFAMMFVGHDITITPDADIAISHLQTNKYDVIFLDHDLGGNQMVSSFSEEKTGYTVAKEVNKTINSFTPVVIHSFNYAGAHNMEMALSRPNVVRAPFGTFSKDILNIFTGDTNGI